MGVTPEDEECERKRLLNPGTSGRLPSVEFSGKRWTCYQSRRGTVTILRFNLAGSIDVALYNEQLTYNKSIQKDSNFVENDLFTNVQDRLKWLKHLMCR